MIDINQQVAYWKSSADEDRLVAEKLIQQGYIRHGLFFTHLALEKILKAIVCVRTGDIAPRLHNLVRLAEIARLVPSQDHLDVLADMNAYSLEGRYPDISTSAPNFEEARRICKSANEVFEWLSAQL